MTCHCLNPLYVYHNIRLPAVCDRCGGEKPEDEVKPLSRTEKYLIMLVLCGVFLLIFENADSIVRWWHG